ncbi:MAG: RNA polymerase subunit sigma-24, partial [Lacrimispora celerecrescens]|nr:RNA polymerase subunit sigma-24 [Lacrimispora celerecrescens]
MPFPTLRSVFAFQQNRSEERNMKNY